jgi:hypothetical protein
MLDTGKQFLQIQPIYKKIQLTNSKTYALAKNYWAFSRKWQSPTFKFVTAAPQTNDENQHTTRV